ncbi:hypothetical protein H9Q19_05290 [Chlamydia crocodili]|uniref:Uncharacterized protein n=1 Tax=Chlamydia crocodili TaxID=2766982 RepID=A0ABX8CI21_9CHLA|nr:hypothetical protein H9Q19_05290 [Chlamydia crocodili]
MVIGASAIAGSASLGLLIFGSVCLSLLILGVVLGKLIKKKSILPLPRSETIQPALSAQGEAALDYARNQLDRERDTIEPIEWVGMRAPMNNDISYLVNLRTKKHEEILNVLRVDNSDHLQFIDNESWGNQRFTSAVTEFLQLSFAIGIYSLRDLETYRERYNVDSNLEALARQNSAYYKTFYMMSTAYSLVRHLYLYCNRENISQEDITARVSRFYEEGTVESEWRSIYNSFCEQARWYLGDEQVADQRECRLIKHSKADLDPDFRHQGTTPT